MTFKEWWKKFQSKFYKAASRAQMPQHFYTTEEVAQEAWETQQSEIDKLEEEILLLEMTISGLGEAWKQTRKRPEDLL